MIRSLICLYLLLFIHSYALGAGGDWKSLHGKMTVSPAPLSDPLPESTPVAFFAIDGESAKTIFNAMVEPKIVKNACGETGMVMKSVGDIVCFKQGRTYTCNFGVGMSDGKSQAGYTC